ncbi:uncharacterized protein LOC106641900 [Copidosoma floridanum]|uniref:uncharacterized protein LOC106641900 n=1 Tax=Copidosoma floridanum TaxID=29053 RepID=UPI0006C9E59E|nr:uncharacterized protein LOC106641900 [Copidosoma floridanum]
MSRAKVLMQKRSTLKGQLRVLETLMAEKSFDTVKARLRFDRVKELFSAYKKLNDELEVIDPNDAHVTKMTNITDRYYTVAAKLKPIFAVADAQSDPSPSGDPLATSSFIAKQKLLKLSVAKLPKFNGQFDRWITFKNAFGTMVIVHTDIDDLVKFFYLKDALQGEALNKISIFDATAANYKSAWKLLIDANDRKRILVAKHLDALIDIKPLEAANAQGLSKLVDDTCQHLNVLSSLGVVLDDTIIVRLLERALPISIRQKWEESLDFDVLPKLTQFSKFVNAMTF